MWNEFGNVEYTHRRVYRWYYGDCDILVNRRSTKKCDRTRIVLEFFLLFWKTTPYGNIFKILFHRNTGRRCCAQFSWNLVDGKSGKSCVIYCADRAQNLPGPAPDDMLTVLQISSKSVDFRRCYSRTREYRQIAP